MPTRNHQLRQMILVAGNYQQPGPICVSSCSHIASRSIVSRGRKGECELYWQSIARYSWRTNTSIRMYPWQQQYQKLNIYILKKINKQYIYILNPFVSIIPNDLMKKIQKFETKIKIIRTNTNSIQTFFHPLTLDHTYHNTLKSIESFNFPISSLLITPLPPSSSPYQPVLITHSYKRRA